MYIALLFISIVIFGILKYLIINFIKTFYFFILGILKNKMVKFVFSYSFIKFKILLESSFVLLLAIFCDLGDVTNCTWNLPTIDLCPVKPIARN